MSLEIRFQADDFFNAFRIISESNDEFFSQKLANKQKTEKAFGGFPAMSPAVVCLAFSIELYLKDLHFVLNGKVPRGHDILKLYKKLPEEIRQDIVSHKAISQNPFHTRGDVLSVRLFDPSYTPYDRFLDQIRAISNAFIEWRYSYERASLHYDESFALAFIEAVKSVADIINSRKTG